MILTVDTVTPRPAGGGYLPDLTPTNVPKENVVIQSVSRVR